MGGNAGVVPRKVLTTVNYVIIMTVYYVNMCHISFRTVIDKRANETVWYIYYINTYVL